MAKALAAAKGVAGVTATTGAYSVYQPNTDNPEYQASQAIDLTMPAPGGAPPETFTGLIGNLQQDGLLLNNLDGQLSPSGQDQASQEATSDALHRLRAQAAAIASTLGDSVGQIKTVNIDGGSQAPMPMGKMVMAMASPPPQAAPGPVSVQVTVSATIELKPGTP
jgi:predicted secreted protein